MAETHQSGSRHPAVHEDIQVPRHLDGSRRGTGLESSPGSTPTTTTPLNYYRDPVEEYWQLLEGVTLWDVGGAERQVEITGPDAFEFTNTLTPRKLHKCAVGQCKYAFITNAEGGIINDPVLLRLDENHFWLSFAHSDVLPSAAGSRLQYGA